MSSTSFFFSGKKVAAISGENECGAGKLPRDGPSYWLFRKREYTSAFRCLSNGAQLTYGTLVRKKNVRVRCRSNRCGSGRLIGEAEGRKGGGEGEFQQVGQDEGGEGILITSCFAWA